MLNARILILSDQEESAEVWAHAVQRRGIYTDVVNLRTAEASFRTRLDTYDVCIIDINDSDADGVTVCRDLRGKFDNPLVLLTYDEDERVHLQFYCEGVDECVVKPIGPVLLLAKIMAWLRRSTGSHVGFPSLRHGDFQLNLDQRSLSMPDGKVIKLSNLESRLALVLLNNRGLMVPTESIVEHVWGDLGQGDSGLLKRLVYRLRRKIEPDPKNPRYVESIPGVGYRFRLQ